MNPSSLRRLLAQRARDQSNAQAPSSLALQRAQSLLAAVDAGGIPLHPGKVNQIAHELGLAVSREEAVEATIARIRECLAAPGSNGQQQPDR